MQKHYHNKVAVITGGASGIGLALCEMLLALEAKAVVIADINENKLQAEAKRLNAAYPKKVLGIKTDVTKQKEVAEMVQRAAEFGNERLDFLFNNAGMGLAKLFDETSDADWTFAFDVNFYSALYGIKAALPIMRAQGSGHIANTASGIGFTPMPQQSMYSATKSALIGLTGSLRYELWDENIRFSSIIPGTVATPIWQGKPPPSAITPEKSATGILKGIAENKRLIFITDDDQQGAIHAVLPEAEQGFDEYFLNIARKRKTSNTFVV